ncbi:MAG: endo alpha-1,4 polygalactosaminidase [Treponema sp.]|nr:endo alpha-1,4 polygalactosaminidase [Treponema sp.]
MKKIHNTVITIIFITICAVCLGTCIDVPISGPYYPDMPNLKDEQPDAMRQFVIDIANYARNTSGNPGFIIIPQNGIELAEDNMVTNDGDGKYVKAINGLGIEDLFYSDDGKLISASERKKSGDDRLDMLDDITGELNKSVKTMQIMVSDYVTTESDRLNSVNLNKNKGFISFPRKNNYSYGAIPAKADQPAMNNYDITKLSDAQNYLYLISTDNYQSHGGKAAFLTDIEKTDYDVVLIDLFFNGTPLTYQEINQLKTKADGGTRLVIAYINIGSAENWRYYWKNEWHVGNPDWLRKRYSGYDDEIWVDFRDSEWQDIIYGNNDSYMKKIIDAGFDGVYLDNVEAYYFIANDE